jgi:hypothetical protein
MNSWQRQTFEKGYTRPLVRGASPIQLKVTVTNKIWSASSDCPRYQDTPTHWQTVSRNTTVILILTLLISNLKMEAACSSETFVCCRSPEDITWAISSLKNSMSVLLIICWYQQGRRLAALNIFGYRRFMSCTSHSGFRGSELGYNTRKEELFWLRRLMVLCVESKGVVRGAWK